jgi:hypothetical protein
MTWGGKREGAGRKQGSRLQKTAAIAHRLVEEGQTPLEYILAVMRDPSHPTELRLDCAKAALAYIHPRIAQVQNLTQSATTIVQNNYGDGALRKAWERVERDKEQRLLAARSEIVDVSTTSPSESLR